MALKYNKNGDGFTIIELAIVLVIIGLIVGGVLVGQDLIRAAQVRAQITQIEKYQTAANTFRGKYNYLPGDIVNASAVQFGLAARGLYAGEGDGNGVLEGVWQNWILANNGIYAATGEIGMFWVDLSATGLIEGKYTTATPATAISVAIPVTGLSAYTPLSNLSNSVFVYISSNNATNYFMISILNGLNSVGGEQGAGSGITTRAAFAIDNKIDDGLPQSGRVLAQYNNGGMWWVGATGTQAVNGATSTCYDNNGSLGATQQYSVAQANGAGSNCALSIQFQ